MNHRKIFWWGVLLTYVVSTVALHRRVNSLAGVVLHAMGLPQYLFATRVIGAVSVLAVCIFLVRSLWKDPQRRLEFIIFIPLAAIFDLSSISVPIERIHYLQYGILTWLCYQVIGRPFPAAMTAFFIGMFDEANQYFVLYPEDRLQYMDWNDMGLNLIGIVAVLLFFLPRQPVAKLQWKRIALAIIAWVLFVNVLVMVFKPDRYFMRDDPYRGSGSYWILSDLKTTYHVMRAAEGISVLGGLLIFLGGYYLPRRTGSELPQPEKDFSQASSPFR